MSVPRGSNAKPPSQRRQAAMSSARGPPAKKPRSNGSSNVPTAKSAAPGSLGAKPVPGPQMGSRSTVGQGPVKSSGPASSKPPSGLSSPSGRTGSASSQGTNSQARGRINTSETVTVGNKGPLRTKDERSGSSESSQASDSNSSNSESGSSDETDSESQSSQESDSESSSESSESSSEDSGQSTTEGAAPVNAKKNPQKTSQDRSAVSIDSARGPREPTGSVHNPAQLVSELDSRERPALVKPAVVEVDQKSSKNSRRSSSGDSSDSSEDSSDSPSEDSSDSSSGDASDSSEASSSSSSDSSESDSDSDDIRSTGGSPESHAARGSVLGSRGSVSNSLSDRTKASQVQQPSNQIPGVPALDNAINREGQHVPNSEGAPRGPASPRPAQSDLGHQSRTKSPESTSDSESGSDDGSESGSESGSTNSSASEESDSDRSDSSDSESRKRAASRRKLVISSADRAMQGTVKASVPHETAKKDLMEPAPQLEDAQAPADADGEYHVPGLDSLAALSRLHHKLKQPARKHAPPPPEPTLSSEEEESSSDSDSASGSDSDADSDDSDSGDAKPKKKRGLLRDLL